MLQISSSSAITASWRGERNVSGSGLGVHTCPVSLHAVNASHLGPLFGQHALQGLDKENAEVAFRCNLKLLLVIKLDHHLPPVGGAAQADDFADLSWFLQEPRASSKRHSGTVSCQVTSPRSIRGLTMTVVMKVSAIGSIFSTSSLQSLPGVPGRWSHRLSAATRIFFCNIVRC